MAKLTFTLEDESGNNTTMTRTRCKGDWYYHELSDFLENVFDELGEDLKHELNVRSENND
jgi:hypothetical protein